MVLNAGMNSIKAETSRYLTIQERIIRLSPHTVVVILGAGVPAGRPVPAGRRHNIVSSTYKYRFHEGDPYKDGRSPIPPPKPTPKYPAIDGYLQQDVAKFEEGQRAGGQAGDDVEDSIVAVRVELMPANTEAVAAWLRSNGVSPYAGGSLIEADVPLSLLAALSQQDGVYRITPIRPPMVDSPSR